MLVGTRGSPKAPTRMASNSRPSVAKPSGGTVTPSARYRVAPQSNGLRDYLLPDAVAGKDCNLLSHVQRVSSDERVCHSRSRPSVAKAAQSSRLIRIDLGDGVRSASGTSRVTSCAAFRIACARPCLRASTSNPRCSGPRRRSCRPLCAYGRPAEKPDWWRPENRTSRFCRLAR